jgi:NAD(P)-dependent dehydrogenase (short-subunit alcohol dehydrogenase family)
MQLEFKGKRVLVTCGGAGIGRAAAEAFYRLGARVAIHDAQPNRVARIIVELGTGDRLMAMPGELSSVAQIKQTVGEALERMGGLDVLVNGNIGCASCPVNEIRPQYWTRTLNETLKSMFFVAQACVPALAENKGCIVNITSSLGLIGAAPGSTADTAVQHGIVQMTRMMALELAPAGVRVNAVAPGYIQTPLSDGSAPSPDTMCSMLAGSTPLERAGKPEEAAAGIVYLASGLASFTTGAILAVDGGVASGRYV